MARRIELSGIANALNGSFVSRNNDFARYWAIGQLKSLAINNALSSITFSLIAPTPSSTISLKNYILWHYSNMLEHLLKKQQIPNYWVREASITIDFSVRAKYEQLDEFSSSSEPFQCCCKIIDETGRCYSSIIDSQCQPHSAVKELKSVRKHRV
ncbi:hypothetical protein [Providencia rettgeri]|uniref:hypothetical protein n=1 Tax=Providencia rettgeri TaxID=587 RepID=UPI0018C6CD79|nr:hypothetical protein [Providencia rettgeri]MBG5925759.1 hypothetical protein [Providencia rettgeri]